MRRKWVFSIVAMIQQKGGAIMGRGVASDRGRRPVSRAGRWATVTVTWAILAVMVAVALPSVTMAASDRIRRVLGAGCQIVVNQLPEPVVKPGFKFKVGYLQRFLRNQRHDDATERMRKEDKGLWAGRS